MKGAIREFEFEFGGNTPVRTLLPVPIAVIPTASASGVTVDSSGFSGVLSASDTNVQAALATIDAIDGTGIAYDNSNTNLIATNVQQAIDALYALLFPEITSFDGGSPNTNDFVYTLEGGDPSTEPDQTVDGGDPQDPVDGGDS